MIVEISESQPCSLSKNSAVKLSAVIPPSLFLSIRLSLCLSICLFVCLSLVLYYNLQKLLSLTIKYVCLCMPCGISPTSLYLLTFRLRLYPKCMFPECTNPDHVDFPNTIIPIIIPRSSSLDPTHSRKGVSRIVHLRGLGTIHSSRSGLL